MKIHTSITKSLNVSRSLLILFLILNLLSPLFMPGPFGSAVGEVDKERLGSGPGMFNCIVADDIDDDNKYEIVVGNYDGYVLVLEYREGDFYEEWRSPKFGHRVWGITVADFLGDSGQEIIAGNGDGEIVAYDAKTHKKVWHTDKFGDRDLVRDIHGLFVSDLGHAGERYLIAGTGYKNDKDLGTIYIFKANGTKGVDPIAKIPGIHNRLRGIVVGDVDGDSELELVFGSGVTTGDLPGEGYIHIYDMEGVLNNDYENALEWRSDDLKGCCNAVELADLTGDDVLDIVVGNGYRYQAGWVRILKYDKGIQEYTEYWKSPDIGPKPYGLAVADIDDDNRLEIVVGNQPGYIYVYEQSGSGMKKEWQSKLLGSDVLGVDIADVDDDGQLEIVAAQGGYVGKGDYTSGYTEPHIYIIDGKTKEIEIIVGRTNPFITLFQIIILILVIFLLIGLNYYIKYRRRVKALSTDQGTSSSSSGSRKSSSPPSPPSPPLVLSSDPTGGAGDVGHAGDPGSPERPKLAEPHSEVRS